MEKRQREQLTITLSIIDDLKPTDMSMTESLAAMQLRATSLIALELDRIAGHLNRIANAAETMEDK